jgi:hypothetical protein
MERGNGAAPGALAPPAGRQIGARLAARNRGGAPGASGRRLTETHPLPWSYVERSGELLDADGALLARIDPSCAEAARLGALLVNAPVLHEVLRQIAGHMAWTALGSDAAVDELVRQAVTVLGRAAPLRSGKAG